MLTLRKFAIEDEHREHRARLLVMPSEYDHFELLQSIVDFLLNEVGDDEDHPPADLLDVLADHIERYEAIHYPMPSEAKRCEYAAPFEG